MPPSKSAASKGVKMLQNLHTHTVFCDGKDTPEEMILAAISKGFDSLGFSSHAPTEIKDDCEMTDVSEYIKCISELKNKFSDRIKLHLGIELDYYSKNLEYIDRFDYSISSAHYAVLKNGTVVSYDHSAKRTEKHIKEDFSGDGLAYARSYFETVSSLEPKTDISFAGHFDLVTKFSEIRPDLFDTRSAEYRSYAIDALRTLSHKFDFFELNTGAISRGMRQTPYPAPFILDEMRKLGIKLVISSDCHRKEMLDCGFAEAREYAKAHGFSELYFLNESGFVGQKI